MYLTAICDYPYQINIRKFTAEQHRGPNFSLVVTGDLCGLSPQRKFQPQNWNVKHYKSVLFLSIRIVFSPVIYKQSSAFRCYLEQHCMIVCGTFVR